VVLETGFRVTAFAAKVVVITADPIPSPVAIPSSPTGATVLSDELHFTRPVISCVLLSLKVPVATSWRVDPGATTGVVGVIAIEVSAADVTVRIAPGLEVIPVDVKVAVMSQVAAFVPVAIPRWPMVVVAILLLHVSGSFGAAVEATDQET
jgi:hypothetical protein